MRKSPGDGSFNTTIFHKIISNPRHTSSIKIDIQSHERKFSFSEKFWTRWSSRRKKEEKTFLIYFFLYSFTKEKNGEKVFILFVWVF